MKPEPRISLIALMPDALEMAAKTQLTTSIEMGKGMTMPGWKRPGWKDGGR